MAHRLFPAGTPLLILFTMALVPVDALVAPGQSDRPPKHVVVAGAGVIGTTTAYYLAKLFGVPCTVVDPTGEIAPAASGKAGGFLALDWNDYSPVGPLARRSFGLHQQLADDLGADRLQYRRLTCAAVSVNSNNAVTRPKGKKLEGIEWAQSSSVVGARSLGGEETIAQVHPKRLCVSLWEETKKLTPQSELKQGKVVSHIHSDGRLVGVKLADGNTIHADALVYACGPWTANVMTGIKYHSVVLPTTDVLSQCVFFSGCGDPEVYVRPDKTAYCTGFPDSPVQVSEEPGREEVRPEAAKRIRDAVEQASDLSYPVSEDADDGRTVLEQACYLPSTPDGLPLMGVLPNQPDCFVAAGHSCWGILMGPATGEAMAHLVVSGKSPHVDLRSFDPSRVGNGMRMVP